MKPQMPYHLPPSHSNRNFVDLAQLGHYVEPKPFIRQITGSSSSTGGAAAMAAAAASNGPFYEMTNSSMLAVKGSPTNTFVWMRMFVALPHCLSRKMKSSPVHSVLYTLSINLFKKFHWCCVTECWKANLFSVLIWNRVFVFFFCVCSIEMMKTINRMFEMKMNGRLWFISSFVWHADTLSHSIRFQRSLELLNARSSAITTGEHLRILPSDVSTIVFIWTRVARANDCHRFLFRMNERDNGLLPAELTRLNRRSEMSEWTVYLKTLISCTVGWISSSSSSFHSKICLDE